MSFRFTAVLLLFTFSGLQGKPLPAPSGLTTEYLRAPARAVITSTNPRFAWVFPKEGVEQSAYRILVATSPYLLREDHADAWDTGKVHGNSSVNVSYAGNTLKQNNTYWWQVKVWSVSGAESSYSVPQKFLTGEHTDEKMNYSTTSNWVEVGKDQWYTKNRQSASFEHVMPVLKEVNSNGNIYADFARAAFGTLALTVTSAVDNNLITIHLGERCLDDLSVHKEPGVSNIAYHKTEIALTKGKRYYQVEFPERPPSYYLHTQDLAAHYPEVLPFRCIEISGMENSFHISGLRQLALLYYFDDEASHFYSSSQNLNKVWDLCKYTLKATPFLGVYADGNRERMPYEADAYIQQLGHYAVDREYSISSYTIHFLLDHASWPTEWQMHNILMAWEYYMHTGDHELLIERYEDLRRKTLIDLTESNGLISTRTGKVTEEFLRSINFPGPVSQFRDIVDWPHGPAPGQEQRSNQSPWPGGDTDGFVFNDYNSVVNAFHYRSLVLMAGIAAATGNHEDHTFFTERAARHLEAFYSVFFDEASGLFTDGESTTHHSLHANMFPLAFGMVKDEHIATVARFIKSRGMACSVYGAQYLLEALFAAGEAQHAIDLMTTEDKRGWINMINAGATMTTEAWDEYFKPNLTWNHAWGAAPANIIPRKLLGIEPTSPSFETFRMAPQPGNIDTLNLKLPTLRGPVSCQLVSSPDQWIMEVTVPGNSEAELFIPVRFSVVTDQKGVMHSTGTSRLNMQEYHVFRIQSGKHKIEAVL